MNEVPFWVRYFKMLGSSQPWAGFTILRVSEQGLQWVQKNFSGTLPSIPIYFFRDFEPLTLTKNASIGHLTLIGVGGEAVILAWWERQLFTFTYGDLKGLSTWCSVYCSVGRSRRRRNRSENCEKKKLVSPETISNSFISGWSQVYWSEFLFDDWVWRCLKVDIPLQTVLFFLFWSKLSSEYKRIIVRPFLQCKIIILRNFGL